MRSWTDLTQQGLFGGLTQQNPGEGPEEEDEEPMMVSITVEEELKAAVMSALIRLVV